MVHGSVFTSGKCPVVTAFTTTRNTLMIEYGGAKGITRDVARTAIILSGDMRVGLASGDETVMTRRAVANDVCMVEGRADK